MQSRSPKIAVLWINLGFYHVARLRALAVSAEVVPIQLASNQQLYGWHAEPPPNTETIFDGSYESASRRDLVIGTWRALKRIHPSILLIPGYTEPAFLVAALWGKLHGSLNVLMTDSTELDFPRSRRKEVLKSLLIRALFKKAVASGSRSSAYLRSLGMDQQEIGRYYDVVDNDFFSRGTSTVRLQQTAAQFQLPDSYFLFVGRLVAAKNLEQLVQAFHTYRTLGGAWSLVLVGKGPLEMHLRRLVSALDLSKCVIFSGFHEYNDLPPYYSFARCLVLPSKLEQWGLVVNEAMDSGLPVIVSTRCGCVDDLVKHGSNGYVVDPENLQALSKAMLDVASLTPDQYSSMCFQSRSIISEFSLAAWAGEVLRVTSGNRSTSPPLKSFGLGTYSN